MIPGKPTLSLPKTVPTDRMDDDRPFELAVYDVLLPCRQFAVTHKVAELGRVSMTAEFLLRLLRSVDGMDETDFGTFFGFDSLERSFVIREAEESGYVTRKNGRLWLTMTGRGLFRDGADEPQIYDVDTKTVTAGFDLLSIAPAEREPLSRFELKLPELKVEDVGKLSSARKLVPAAFHRFYGEFRSRFGGAAAAKKRSLYSVDHVGPADRFSSLVRIVARSRVGRPGFPEPDLSEWKTGYELDDRSPVVERSAAFLEDLKTSRRPDDAGAYGLLEQIAGKLYRGIQESRRVGRKQVVQGGRRAGGGHPQRQSGNSPGRRSIHRPDGRVDLHCGKRPKVLRGARIRDEASQASAADPVLVDPPGFGVGGDARTADHA